MTTEPDTCNDTKEKEERTSNDSKQNLVDDCFYVEQKKYGLWQSHHPDGKGIITSLTEEECVRATRYYLKLIQEGAINENVVTYSGTVDGKL